MIPKGLRDALALRAGAEIDVEEYGGVIHIRPVTTTARIERQHGRLVAVGSGAVITDNTVRELRDADRR